MNTKSFLNTLEPGKTEEQSAKANIVRGNALLGTVCTLRNSQITWRKNKHIQPENAVGGLNGDLRRLMTS